MRPVRDISLQLSEMTNGRHRRIMHLLHQQNTLSVSQLAQLLKVSEVTVRKDLTELERQELLYRVHGSAILANPYIKERHVDDKEKLHSEEKRAIGIYAARLVAKEKYGVAVAMVNGVVTDNPLSEVAGKSKLVPPDCAMVELARSMGICLG